jgi:hypothetical protein
MFSYKLFKQANDILLAIADSDIIGKKFDAFEVKEDFYAEQTCTDPEELLQKATIVNAVGNKIVDLLIEKGLVDKNNILELGKTKNSTDTGIKHAQIIKI